MVSRALVMPPALEIVARSILEDPGINQDETAITQSQDRASKECPLDPP